LLHSFVDTSGFTAVDGECKCGRRRHR